jgi:hypothetical protein
MLTIAVFSPIFLLIDSVSLVLLLDLVLQHMKEE